MGSLLSSALSWWSIALQMVAIVHFIRRRPNFIWIWIILFGGGNDPHLGQFAAANQAVLALSPDGGAVGGSAPLNVLVDLATGKVELQGPSAELLANDDVRRHYLGG